MTATAATAQPAPIHRAIDEEAHLYHAPAQVGRFLAWYAVTLAVQVLWGGKPLVGWADLRSLLIGALPVAYRQWRKTMPVPAAHRAAAQHDTDSAETGAAG